MAFTTYNLSQDQVIALTRLCYQEQGSDAGAAAEASLMCNRFEWCLKGSYRGQSGATGLYNYVKNSGWWAQAASFMAGSGNYPNPSSSQVANIQAVFSGRRTLPGYVDEHDCWSDISYVESRPNGPNLGNKRDKSQYVQHQTIIHNNMGAKYTFYAFPDTEDPFGYTCTQEQRAQIGEESYGGQYISSADGGNVAGSVARSYQTDSKVYETANTITGDGDESWKTFYKWNMTTPAFITQCLIPYARSARTGQAGYRFYLSDSQTTNGGNGTTVYFKPDEFSQSNSLSILDNIDKHYEFEWGVNGHSSVISFSPEAQGVVMAAAGGGEVEAKILDSITNEYVGTKMNRYTNPDRPTTGATDMVDTGDEGKTVVFASSYSQNELNNMAATLWYQMRQYMYNAELEIVGDPEVQPLSMITIMVLNKNGLPHHTSGIYLVNEVTDSISGGDYTTTLSLMRNAMDMAVNESGGIDISASSGGIFTGVSSTASSGSGNGIQTGNIGEGVAPNANVEAAIQWAIGIANDDTHGYSQESRNGPNYDCSSLVCWAFHNAGFNTVPNGSSATNTNGMRELFVSRGFTWHPELGNDASKLQRGDICLNENVHTVIYIGGGQQVAANGNQNGKYGQTGDQTGGEISVKNFTAQNYNGVLRWEH